MKASEIREGPNEEQIDVQMKDSSSEDDVNIPTAASKQDDLKEENSLVEDPTPCFKAVSPIIAPQ